VPVPFTDPDLVRAAAAGDRRALDRLVEQWLPVVLRWCWRLSGPRVDPEDAAHEVMLVLMDRVDQVREPARFGAWLYGVVRRVVAASRRRVWWSRWVPGLVVEPRDEAPSAWQRVARDEVARRVQTALEELPSDQREVFVLCEVEELPDEAVAELLGVPAGTVKSRLRLARERLRRSARRHQLDADWLELDRAEGA
jgi:RNA polymerase sigma-70 factor (ECF subfamily)